jgi:CPA1 family monovalent cation:H+ antiporter
METFEWIVALMAGAALLSALARRIGLPYPSLLAVGGAAIALFPSAPNWALDPHLVLVLFVAPVLLDAAYDFSLRDLRRNWITVAGLAIMAVAITVVAVALVARWLVPDMPWSVAIALGAIVAPPDAAAATAVMRQVRLPHRIRTILEGESLINDASALLVYRLAVGAAVAGNVGFAEIVPTAGIVIIGSIAFGAVLAFTLGRMLALVGDEAPTTIVIQFASTFGVWLFADMVGLSGILTIVTFAVIVARNASRVTTPPRIRITVNAVWAVVVFALNALAFVLIGMQLRPILGRLNDTGLWANIGIAVAVLLTSIFARFAWVMAYNLFFRAVLPADVAEDGPGRPTVRGGLVISWAGMRGIVTLATAFALPETLPDGSPFPYRDLVLLCAFAVVFGTLVIQGLTLKGLITLLQLDAPDPVATEVRKARVKSLTAALKAIEDDTSEEARRLREEFAATIAASTHAVEIDEDVPEPSSAVRRKAIDAARRRANELRPSGAIGDEAYRVLENEFDWGQLAAGQEG